uniref:Transmembrane 6 superfamily member 2 n=1 Tax=Monodelphis domestica TaxID=13616 RepID=A0A5F8GID7_MONDO
MELPALSGKVVAFSLTAFPVCYTLNHLSELSYPLSVAILCAMILILLFVAIGSLAQGEISHDPLFAVFAILSFSSLIDLFIALQEDDYGMDFMEFYTRGREPYLRTAHGILSCYWDGTIHYLLYLTMTGAIANRKRYRSAGLYWLGSMVMSIMVFVPGNILGKYSSELRLSFFLNIPYMLIPCWAGLHLFHQDKGPTSYTTKMIAEEHKKGLLQRPWDLALFIYLLLAGLFTIFRGLVSLLSGCPSGLQLPKDPSSPVVLCLQPGLATTIPVKALLWPMLQLSFLGEMVFYGQLPWSQSSPVGRSFLRLDQSLGCGGCMAVNALALSFGAFVSWPYLAPTLLCLQVVLDCPTDSCFTYVYQYEPYLRDPVAYPKIQMLVFLFYALPFFILAAYGLLWPGCTWLPDWALVFAGAMGQAQFSHIGASMHLHTPYPYRTPEDVWSFLMILNLLYALGIHLLAYRCLRWPAFFLCPSALSQEEKNKKDC